MAQDSNSYTAVATGVAHIEGDRLGPDLEVVGAATLAEAMATNDGEDSYVRQTFDTGDVYTGLYTLSFQLAPDGDLPPHADSDDFRAIRMEIAHSGGYQDTGGGIPAYFRDTTEDVLSTRGDMLWFPPRSISPWGNLQGYWLGQNNGLQPADYNTIVDLLTAGTLAYVINQPVTDGHAPFDISYLRFFFEPVTYVVPVAPGVTDVEGSSSDTYEIYDTPGVRYSASNDLGTIDEFDLPPGIYPATGHLYWNAVPRAGYQFHSGQTHSWDYDYTPAAIPTAIIGQLGDSRRTFYGGPST